jgi:transcriptional regulator with PAS, ATPase and Fis domain
MNSAVTGNDEKYLLEHVFGAIVIDMKGIVVYMNEQCAEYLGVEREASIGCHIKNVFPETKMIDGLKLEKPEVVFYHIHGRIGASVHIPLKKNGRKVGLLEYDLFQSHDPMDEFVDNYKLFQSDVVNYYKEEIKHLRSTKYSIDNIIGSSESIRKLKKKIEYAARTNSTVLITGETGTGKELAAHAIHHLSLRKLRDFIKINASALPESLAESELFGYDEGSFTGALKSGKKGKFELAHKGTLFIDEVHQMPMNLQPKLLRVLQEKEIERIGGEKSIPVDVRIIAATNTDLSALITEKKFREDLFYRLNVVEIHLPPLRERLEDLPELTASIVAQLNNVLGTCVRHIHKDVFSLFNEYHWPGNVRELMNVLERAMNYTENDTLEKEHFDHAVINDQFHDHAGIERSHPIEFVRNQAEKMLIMQTLKKTDGNKSRAAKLLQIARPLLYQKMNRLRI